MKRFNVVFKILFVLFLIYISLFGGTALHPTRSLEALWNLGHVLLFALLSGFLLSHSTWLQVKSGWVKILLILFVTLIAGAGIELLQYKFASGRPDLGDMYRNFLGSSIPLLYGRGRWFSNKATYALRLILIVLIGWQFKPVVANGIDEYRTRKQFPVLGDFESPLEISRWSGNGNMNRTKDLAQHGKFSLRIELPVRKYSGFSLNYFPNDWTGYTYLNFNVYYPGTEPFYMICRIHDRQHHRNGYRYRDRFNRRVDLHHGWNKIKINLDEVRQAPEGREMDMSKIVNWALFAVDIEHQQEIYLDYVYLSN